MGRSPIVVSMDSVYLTLLALGIVYVRDDEAFGERYKVAKNSSYNWRLPNRKGRAVSLFGCNAKPSVMAQNKSLSNHKSDRLLDHLVY